MADDHQTRWDRAAADWGDQAGAEGNSFHLRLVSPAAEQLLGTVRGQRVLDVACGNGVFARRLAQLGATVVATDISAAMLERAREHPSDRIDYRQVDATSPRDLGTLDGPFDAIVCNQAFMTMPDVAPLAAAVPALLGPGGRLVFTTNHPCFNTTATRFVYEWEERDARAVERRGVAITRYAAPGFAEGAVLMDRGATAIYFDRPLHMLLQPFFDAGLVLDGLEEPVFPPSEEIRRLDWRSISEIPPVIACRLRPR
jgi:2-polyprenyl-3-methyl-5-hydroxy-6-metoxy-1,4-benzoquinol methylase